MRGGKRGHALVAESAKVQAAAERGAAALEREVLILESDYPGVPSRSGRVIKF